MIKGVIVIELFWFDSYIYSCVLDNAQELEVF